MAYNVFKRPMFKRGGSTTGTGIMSHVEPRINAQGGAFTQSGNTLLFGREGNDPLSILGFNIPGTQAVEGSTIPTRDFASDLSFIAGPGKFMKAGGAGLNLLRQLPSFGKYSKFPPGYPSRSLEGVKNIGGDTLQPANMPSIFTNRGIIERLRPYGSGAYEIGKQGVKEAGQLAKNYGIAAGGTGAGAYGLYSLLKDQDQKTQIVNNAATNAINKEGSKDIKKDNTYKETDRRSKIAIEADEIMKAIRDEDMDKAQAFLLISDALKQGGSIADKINYAVKKGKDIAVQKAKDKQAATLLAYQTIAKREEPTTTEKAVNSAAALKAKLATTGKLSPTEQAQLEYYDDILKKESGAEKLAQSYYFANMSRLPGIEKRIKEAQAKIKDPKAPEKSLSKDDLESYIKDVTEYRRLKKYEATLPKDFLATGGRPGYAEGTPPTPEGDVIATETAGESNAVPMQPVEKLTFEDLRNRLPAEITDDIVQLIASSEQALQDFAYIKSQSDVNNFNVKYGVNLILPPQKG